MDLGPRLAITPDQPDRAVTEGEGGGIAKEDGVDDEGIERELLNGRHGPMLPLRELAAAEPPRRLARIYGGTYIGGEDYLRSRQAGSHPEQARLDFLDAASVLEGRTYTIEDRRRDYGEVRYQTVGFLNGRMVMVVWTPRQEAVHVISMRKCNEREQETHRQRLGQG